MAGSCILVNFILHIAYLTLEILFNLIKTSVIFAPYFISSDLLWEVAD